MSENFVYNYIKAGKAVIAAHKLAKTLVKPGALFLEIANKVEAEVLDSGAQLAFPINMSLNEIAAHYSSPINDATVVPDKGLLKIDIGANVNGFIADHAFTVNINGDSELENYVIAAKEALDAAIALFKPGTKLFELGEAIANKITNRSLRPIYNLGGHELKQNVLHAGNFIPNYKELIHNQVLKPGDAYACEPFTTSGIGKVENGKNAYIYRLVKKSTKNLSYDEKNFLAKIDASFGNLPFSPRWIENKNLFPMQKIQRSIESFVGKKILDKYPVLIEKTGAYVAQEEHTIVIDMDGNTIVTTRE